MTQYESSRPSKPSSFRKLKNAGGSPRDGFQAGGTSWEPDRPDICDLLQSSKHVEMRHILYGSNACYLVVLAHPGAGRSLAVYKPARGEYPLWDFPMGSLHRREVATYRLDLLLKWGVIPPTVLGSGKFGRGSVQLFMEQGGNEPVSVASLRRLILLDWVTNNADRKPDHLLVGVGGRLWGIDHGLTFHAQPKLRTVLWHFAGERMEEDEIGDLKRLRDLLCSSAGDPVQELLTADERRALLRRVESLGLGGVFPDPQHKAIPYRW